MKKIFAIILCFALIISCVACSSDDKAATDKKGENGQSAQPDQENCKHTFKEEIYKEPNYGVNGVKIKHCTIFLKTEYISIPALPAIFEVQVKNKRVSSDENKRYVLFDIEIKNTSDKKIESISGNLSIMPPDCIFELICEFDNLSLAPNSTKTISSHGYSFDINSSDNTVEKKVYDAEFESIKFNFSASDIVVAK